MNILPTSFIDNFRNNFKNRFYQFISPNFFYRLVSIELNSIQFNSIQFNSIQFNSIQFNTIQFDLIKFYSIDYIEDTRGPDYNKISYKVLPQELMFPQLIVSPHFVYTPDPWVLLSVLLSLVVYEEYLSLARAICGQN